MSCIEQLEKAEEQEKLLEESKVKLEKRRQKEDEMRKQLQKTEVDLYTYTHIHTHTRTHIHHDNCHSQYRKNMLYWKRSMPVFRRKLQAKRRS